MQIEKWGLTDYVKSPYNKWAHNKNMGTMKWNCNPMWDSTDGQCFFFFLFTAQVLFVKKWLYQRAPSHGDKPTAEWWHCSTLAVMDALEHRICTGVIARPKVGDKWMMTTEQCDLSWFTQQACHLRGKANLLKALTLWDNDSDNHRGKKGKKKRP